MLANREVFEARLPPPSLDQTPRLMEALLFEVRPNDAATLAGVAALITGVAAAASLIPAFRATRVDPLVALREE